METNDSLPERRVPVIIRCPLCGEMLPGRRGDRGIPFLKTGGRRLYFCSDECKRLWQSEESEEDIRLEGDRLDEGFAMMEGEE